MHVACHACHELQAVNDLATVPAPLLARASTEVIWGILSLDRA